jgi:hypothetical protein
MVPPNAHRDAHPEIHFWHALHKAEQMKTKGGADAEWIFKILASTGALGMEYGYPYSECEESTEKSRPTDATSPGHHDCPSYLFMIQQFEGKGDHEAFTRGFVSG